MANPSSRWDRDPIYGFWLNIDDTPTGGKGKTYSITPLLAHLDTPIPGINLGLIEVPPGTPNNPAPMYAKNIAGGVAGLDGDAKVPLANLPDIVGGGGATELADLDDVDIAGIVDGETMVWNSASNKMVPGAPASSTDWDSLPGRPDVVAAGASQAAAREEIGIVNGTTSTAGLVQFATAGDTTSTNRAMTPALVKALLDAVVNGAPGALDTLNELAAALGNDASFATTITNALAARVRTDTASQGLNSTQQSNARTNLGLDALLAARVRTDTASQGLTAAQQANARTNIDVLPTRVFNTEPTSGELAALPNPCLVVVTS